MKHLVVEGSVLYRWDGLCRWVRVPLQLVSGCYWPSGPAYMWPDREMAERCGFIPPTEPGGWIAVADRLPAERRYCAVTDGEDIACRLWNHQLQEWIEFESAEYPAVDDAKITHWLPLPLALPR
jgi:hypothetical protein